MPKNLSVIDVLPKNEAVIDVISKNLKVIDILPKNMAINPQTITRSYEVVIGAGQWTGFLLQLTYPVLGTVNQWSEVG